MEAGKLHFCCYADKSLLISTTSFLNRAMYYPSCDMANGRLRTPAPTMAVTLWKAEYHHFASLDDVMGSQSSIAFSFAVRRSTCWRLLSHQIARIKNRLSYQW